MDTSTSTASSLNLFDGNQVDPQAAVVLKKFIRDNTPSGVVGRSHAPATTTLSGATTTKIDFGTNDFAIGITWDSSNHRFTALTAGYYLVTASINFTSMTLNDHLHAYIERSGAIVTQNDTRNPIVAAETVMVTDIVKLAVGDYIELFGRDDDNNVGINTGSAQTFLSITEL